MKKYYSQIRSLHLYIGLFISPFVLIFAISVLVINHPQVIDKITPAKKIPAVNVRLDSIPLGSSNLLTAKAIIKKLDITGEVDYINKSDSIIFFPVRTPGKLFNVNVNTRTKMASITRTDLGALRGTIFMHFMPGPHNASLRGNSGFIKVWRLLSDTTVYALLFITISGIFLWYFIKSERTLGWYSLAIGILILTGLTLFTF